MYLLIIFFILLLNGCAVGPDFTPPADPTVKKYTMRNMTKTLKAGHNEPKQNLIMGGKVTNEWWELFHSRQLNDVVALSLANNPTLASAEYTLAAAQQAIKIAAGALYPQVNANAGFQRSNSPSSSSSSSSSNSASVSNLYTVGAR